MPAASIDDTQPVCLRIFSYRPNPRVWKATIAARLCDLRVELRGASPPELQSWLWDFDARRLTDAEIAAGGANVRRARKGFQGALHKTDAFLEAHPFGTVPAAFSPDGAIGIFESNSIMRAVARLGEDRCPLYGANAYEAARVDGFLDVSLVLARDTQQYLLGLNAGDASEELWVQTKDAVETYLAGIERALSPDRRFLVGDRLSLADICFVAEITMVSIERLHRARFEALGRPFVLRGDLDTEFPRAIAHYRTLSEHPAFAPDVGPFVKKLEQNSSPGAAVGGHRV